MIGSYSDQVICVAFDGYIYPDQEIPSFVQGSVLSVSDGIFVSL